MITSKGEIHNGAPLGKNAPVMRVFPVHQDKIIQPKKVLQPIPDVIINCAVTALE